MELKKVLFFFSCFLTTLVPGRLSCPMGRSMVQSVCPELVGNFEMFLAPLRWVHLQPYSHHHHPPGLSCFAEMHSPCTPETLSCGVSPDAPIAPRGPSLQVHYLQRLGSLWFHLASGMVTC